MATETTTLARPEDVLQNPIEAAIETADKLGTWMASSGMFGCTKPEQGKVMALTCVVERMTPAEFKRTYHLSSKGEIIMRFDAMMGRFKHLGGDFDVLESTEEICRVKFLWQGKEYTEQFTIEQARKKGLIKKDSAWEQWPEDMLYATVCRKFLKRYLPEHFAGIDTEHEDVPAKPTAPAAKLDLTKAAEPATPEPKPEKAAEPEVIAPEKTEEPEQTKESVPEVDFAAWLKDEGFDVSQVMAWAVDNDLIKEEDIKGVPVIAAVKMIPAHQQEDMMDNVNTLRSLLKRWIESREESDAADAGLKTEDNSGNQEKLDQIAKLFDEHNVDITSAIRFFKSKRWLLKNDKLEIQTLGKLSDEKLDKIILGINGLVNSIAKWEKEDA
jgi:hypothetical protein